MTSPIESDDRLRRAFEALSDGATFGDGCPAADDLYAAARGELSPERVTHLTNHLVVCGACAEAWRVAREFGEPAAIAATSNAAWKLWMPLAAAALVAIGGIAEYRVVTPSESAPPPVAQVNPPPRAAPAPPTFLLPLEKAEIQISSRYALTWRGQGSPQRYLQDLADGLALYRSGDYPAAVSKFQQVATQYPDTGESHFYLGMSYLLGGDAAAAIEPLRRAIDLVEDAAVKNDVRWNLAVAYERSGDAVRTVAELRAICLASAAADTRGACRFAERLQGGR